MKKISPANFTIPLTILISLSLAILPGCAKKFGQDNLREINSITLARLESGPLLRVSFVTGALAGMGVILGELGAGAGIGSSYLLMKKNGEKIQTYCKLPDFGELLAERMFLKLSGETGYWPNMVVEDGIVDNDFSNDNHILLVKVKSIHVKDGEGLAIDVETTLKEPNNQVLFKKTFRYLSKYYDREDNLYSLTKQRGKQFKIEYDYAAETISQDFIDYLN